MVQYIVGVTGRVEPESLEFLLLSHPSLVTPTRETLLASRFSPAKIRGQPVRQLVQQAFVFRLDQ